VTPAGCIVKKDGVVGRYFGTFAETGGDSAQTKAAKSGAM
jgi:hypothetical protein